MGLFCFKDGYLSESKRLNLNGFGWVCFFVQPEGFSFFKSGMEALTAGHIIQKTKDIPVSFPIPLPLPQPLATVFACRCHLAFAAVLSLRSQPYVRTVPTTFKRAWPVPPCEIPSLLLPTGGWSAFRNLAPHRTGRPESESKRR